MWRVMSRTFLSLLLLSLSGVAHAATAERRIALVIGNSNYALAPLSNPKNDAGDVAAALRQLRFDVVEHRDLTVADFDRALDEFARKADGADVALFYFSGHGLRIDKRGFLAPIDVKVESVSSALRKLVAIQEVVARVERGAKISVVLLDACRDSPLQERVRRVAVEKNKELIPARGLPRIEVTGSNTLVVYATIPGETASDGTGRNSPFTAAFLRHVGTPGLEIELMFKRVTADVLRETGGRQQPERLSRLQSELVLLPVRYTTRPQAETVVRRSKSNRLPIRDRVEKPTLAEGKPLLPEPPTGKAGLFFAQVGILNIEEHAQKAFYVMREKYRNVIGSYPTNIQQVDLGEKGIWYRLRVGPFTELDEADQVCNNLKDAGWRQCFVVNDDAVEPGQFTKAAIHHQAGRIEFKLTEKAGGEALAATIWRISTQDGTHVKTSSGAFPFVVLPAGSYIVKVEHADHEYEATFSVVPGEEKVVEVVMP